MQIYANLFGKGDDNEDEEEKKEVKKEKKKKEPRTRYNAEYH